MLPTVRFGRTGLHVPRLALGGYPFGGVNRARGWDPFTPDGRKAAIRTIHAAIEAGITYVDTAPGYGNGNSESIYGEALEGRRGAVAVATKCGYRCSAADVVASVEASLGRLRTDRIDVVQFHGGEYTPDDVRHIVDDGLLDAFEQLREQGKVRYLGFTTEEPWTGIPLMATGRFDMCQLRYNLIYQAAGEHALDRARELDMGVAVMRPMTSGVFQRIASYLAPKWNDAHDLYQVALEFVLSDSRVHVANVGMRWPEEIEKNVALVAGFAPSFDMADLPRRTSKIYLNEDEMKGFPGE